jgi:hypothetical protein
VGTLLTNDDCDQRRRGQPSSRTTTTTKATTKTTTTTTTTSFTTTTTTKRMLSAAFLLAALSLAPPPSHAAISTTGPVPPLQVSPHARSPEPFFRSQALLPCVAAVAVAVAGCSGSRSQLRGQVLRRSCTRPWGMTRTCVGSSSLVARAAADSRTATPTCSISTPWPGRNRRRPRPSRRLRPQGAVRCTRWICPFLSASFLGILPPDASNRIVCFPRYSRRGFLVYGGKGATGALADVWVRAH